MQTDKDITPAMMRLGVLRNPLDLYDSVATRARASKKIVYDINSIGLVAGRVLESPPPSVENA